MLIRKKRLKEGKYNVQIIEIKEHVSKQNDEGLLIKFKVIGELSLHSTRISKMASFLIDNLAEVLCGDEDEISYEDAVGRVCIFDIAINGDYINLKNVYKLEDDKYDNHEIITDNIDEIIDDVNDIIDFDKHDFPDFEDEDFLNFEEDEEDLV